MEPPPPPTIPDGMDHQAMFINALYPIIGKKKSNHLGFCRCFFLILWLTCKIAMISKMESNAT